VNAPLNLLAIHIDKRDCQRLIGIRRVFVLFLIREDRHPLVLNRLTRPVNRSIGKEEGAGNRFRERLLAVSAVALAGDQPAGPDRHVDEGAAIDNIRQSEQPVGVGLDRCSGTPRQLPLLAP